MRTGKFLEQNQYGYPPVVVNVFLRAAERAWARDPYPTWDVATDASRDEAHWLKEIALPWDVRGSPQEVRAFGSLFSFAEAAVCEFFLPTFMVAGLENIIDLDVAGTRLADFLSERCAIGFEYLDSKKAFVVLSYLALRTQLDTAYDAEENALCALVQRINVHGLHGSDGEVSEETDR